MKLLEGRIGLQETACTLGISAFYTCVLPLRLQVYEKGNVTYFWAPASVLLSLLGLLLALRCMRRCGTGDLVLFYQRGLRRAGAGAALLLLSLLVFAHTFMLLSDFVKALRNYVYTRADYAAILPWVLAAAAYIAWGGMERVGRTARCFGLLLLLFLLAVLLIPIKSYAAYRLLPLPDAAVREAALNTLMHSSRTLPLLLCGACLGKCVQGVRSLRRAACVAMLIVVLLAALTQLAIGMTYTAEQLQDVFMPLFRLDMGMLKEGYYLRLDKMDLFIWTLGAMLSAGAMLYGAAYVLCRAVGGTDIRPALASLTVLLYLLLYRQLEQSGHAYYEAVQQWVAAYGGAFVWLPLLLCCVLAPLRKAEGKERAA